MGLSSLFSKNKQAEPSDQSAYQSRAAEDSSAVRASRKRKTPDNQTNDPILPEKKRARRRLVGAVALVLAVVIILPMILDPEPKPLTNDIKIDIPSRDQASAAAASSSAASVTSPTTAAVASASASSVNTVGSNGLDNQEEIVDPASTTVAAAIAAATPALPSTNVATAAAAGAGVVSDKAPAKPKPVEKPKAKEKVAPVKPERKSNAEAEDAARAAAILNGRPYEAPADSEASGRPVEKKAGKFIIQVAALASQDKVDELQGKLSGAGIRSYTQKVKTSSGERIRIRVGPFASKEEAEKNRAKLSQLGLSGTLVPN
ncbi:SPOR domain-containing protein [Glaciimonas soli]|uniref:SPOR domain-containing protein n=1 Tax=Glaciimonas soli TaxID=2590999 RepID=A0A843YN20_9BURK|nr:SPOR domain-containing protein [Glaciimonas soli]MQQ99376.1 hypothetical protein [Glaciimonas soli]